MSTARVTTGALAAVDADLLLALAGALQDALYRHEQALAHPGGPLDATQTRIGLYAALEGFYRAAKDLTDPVMAPQAPRTHRAYRPSGSRR